MTEFVEAYAKTGTYVGTRLQTGIEQYLGIRYAKPVARWKRAELPEDSDTVIAAYNDNPACWQTVAVEEFAHGEPPMSDDCLYLNVWTSGCDGKKPVYIFIHGGSYVTGSCRTDCFGGVYCGDKFVAEHPDIVYVNIEYRVGPMGSMDLSRFEGGEDYAGSINLQTTDQALAIKWVYENIAAFGGDPERITIGGQSAGSYAVFVLMAMPEVAPLIKGVIAESTAVSNEVLRQDRAACEGGFDKFFELAGVTTLEEALALPPTTIVSCGDTAKFKEGFMGLFGPVCDGTELTDDIEGVWTSGACKHIALMAGTVSGEFATSVVNSTPDEIADMIRGMFPAVTDEDLEAYRRGNYPERDAHEGMEDMFNDILIRAAHTKAVDAIARGGSNAFAYYIDYQPEGNKMRAQHCFELPYIADKLGCGCYLDINTGETLLGDNPDPEFGRKIRDVWANFIKTGNPNGPTLDIEWPAHSPEGKGVMVMQAGDWEVVPEVRPKDLEITLRYN